MVAESLKQPVSQSLPQQYKATRTCFFHLWPQRKKKKQDGQGETIEDTNKRVISRTHGKLSD